MSHRQTASSKRSWANLWWYRNQDVGGSEGRKHRGGFVGTREAEEQYASKKIDELAKQIVTLSEIAKSEPHSAYAVFVKGFQHKLNYHIRVLHNIAGLLAPLDYAIDHKLIPALTDGYVCSADERLLLSMSVKQGGLSFPILATLFAHVFTGDLILEKFKEMEIEVVNGEF